MTTLTYSTTLDTLSCGTCEIPFAIPRSMHDKVLDTGTSFWCPNGHKISYHTSENDKLRNQLEAKERSLTRERSRRDQAQAEADHQAAVARGYKGALVKTKKRAAKGVCPAPGCKRSFVDVARHVATQHPDLRDDTHPEETGE